MARLRDTGAAAAGPVVLVRYRPGVVGERARNVPVVPLTTGSRAGAVRALCGAVLMLAEMDTVTPGEGMPCTACVLDRMSGTAAIGELARQFTSDHPSQVPYHPIP